MTSSWRELTEALLHGTRVRTVSVPITRHDNAAEIAMGERRAATRPEDAQHFTPADLFGARSASFTSTTVGRPNSRSVPRWLHARSKQRQGCAHAGVELDQDLDVCCRIGELLERQRAPCPVRGLLALVEVHLELALDDGCKAVAADHVAPVISAG